MIASNQEILTALAQLPDDFAFDQYLLYPAKTRDAWRRFLRVRLEEALEHPEFRFFGKIQDDAPCLIGVRIPQWDLEHFGFAMASMQWFVVPETGSARELCGSLIGECLDWLRSREVRFVSARAPGDDLNSIHALEAAGFRYYEDVLYSVKDLKETEPKLGPRTRLFQEADIPRLLELAESSQYKRGHFYTDARFDRRKTNSMYTKWVRSSIERNEQILVIEIGAELAGYFIFLKDQELSEGLGESYGRMTSLALDPRYRGRRAGEELFQSVQGHLKGQGVRFVASEYAARNHVSARLHTKSGFFSCHEKVLFHLWLD